MYTTCVIWLAFAAVHFATDVKVFSLCVATNASAYVVLIFLFFPTEYYWDRSTHDDFFSINIFQLLKSVDTDYNACPSLHVGLSYAGSFVYFAYKKYTPFMIFFIWGTLVSVSTLTIKQHFFVDVLFGTFLSLLVTTTIVILNRVQQTKKIKLPLVNQLD